MTKAKLNHVFDLYKQNAHTPLVQVQMNVEFNPQTKEAKAIGLALYCHITKSFIDITPMMDKLFFKGIISQEIAITDWCEVHKAHLYAEIALQERIKDNQACGIADESFVYGDFKSFENEKFMQEVNHHFERQMESNY